MSVAVTSALTGPGTISQIFFIVSLISLPDFAINDGFVVTPSTRFISESSLISFISAVSTKNFILSPTRLNIRNTYINQMTNLSNLRRLTNSIL